MRRVTCSPCSLAGVWARRVRRRKAALLALDLVTTRRQLAAQVQRVTLGYLRLQSAGVGVQRELAIAQRALADAQQTAGPEGQRGRGVPRCVQRVIRPVGVECVGPPLFAKRRLAMLYPAPAPAQCTRTRAM